MTDFGPDGLGTSKWIPGAASTLATLQVSCGQPQEPLSLAWKKDQPLQNSAQESRCLLATRLKVGEGRMVECYMALESELLLPKQLCTMFCF